MTADREDIMSDIAGSIGYPAEFDPVEDDEFDPVEDDFVVLSRERADIINTRIDQLARNTAYAADRIAKCMVDLGDTVGRSRNQVEQISRILFTIENMARTLLERDPETGYTATTAEGTATPL